MPAYYELSVEFERRDIYTGLMTDFYGCLTERCGLKFLCGVREGEAFSLQEIVKWNQEKLRKNFTLGMNQHYSLDYRQANFDYGCFEEVRGFWMNKYPCRREFCFFLIIPESDLLTLCAERTEYRRDNLRKVRELAVNLWNFPLVRSIQTGLELSDIAPPLSKIKDAAELNANPFAIVPQSAGLRIDGAEYIAEQIGRQGLFITDRSFGGIWL